MQLISNHIVSLVLKIKTSVLKYVDPVFLAFILLICNYRFSFKIIALVLIYLYRPDFKFKKSGILYFYGGIILLAVFNLLFVSRDLSTNHVMVVLSACLIWSACFLVYHQVSLFIERTETGRLINTLKVLVILNFLASLADLGKIMLITKTINPYNQPSPPPYGISSGDLIGGIFGEMHLVNITVSFMMLLFFIYRTNFLYVLLSLIPLLLAGSNLGTLITIAILLCAFMMKKDKLVKYYVLFCIAISAVFYIKITPKNLSYLNATLQKSINKVKHKPVAPPDSHAIATAPPQKSAEQIKNEKIHHYIVFKYGHNFNNDTVYHIKAAYLQKLKESNQKLEDYTHSKKDSLKKAKIKDKRFDYGNLEKFDFNAKSGKVISFIQTKNVLLSDWRYLCFGAGPGSFSSRLAFITSGIVDDSRILMMIPGYENPLFKTNHEAIFKYLLFLDDEYHSVTNLPFCWYNELFGEYGMTGALLFVIFYLGFFIKRIKLLSFGKLLLLSMLLFFLFDYWYQRLCVMILFECMMLLDIKIQMEKQNKTSLE